MKKYIYIILLVFLVSKAYSHNEHYQGLKKIEMEVLRNGNVIGYSNYFFEHKGNKLEVKNYTKFKVDLLGVTIFSILSEGLEIYENDKLIHFKSNTFQNNKEKYVRLNYDESSTKFVIDGSSYKGKAEIDCVIGNWWNHRILKAKKQISPLSGSIKDQIVTPTGQDYIVINGKKYLTERFKLKSKDQTLSKDKKLDFDIWYNKENNLILKVSYSRMGNWEYRIKNFE